MTASHFMAVDMGCPVAHGSSMSVGKRIRALRKTHPGLTQGGLAEAIGVKEMTVSRWERGQWRPDKGNLKQLATYFGVSEARIEYGDEEMSIAEPIHDEELSLIDRALAMYSPVAPDESAQVRQVYEENRRFLDGGGPGRLVDFVGDELTAYRAAKAGRATRTTEAPFDNITPRPGATPLED